MTWVQRCMLSFMPTQKHTRQINTTNEDCIPDWDWSLSWEKSCLNPRVNSLCVYKALFLLQWKADEQVLNAQTWIPDAPKSDQGSLPIPDNNRQCLFSVTEVELSSQPWWHTSSTQEVEAGESEVRGQLGSKQYDKKKKKKWALFEEAEFPTLVSGAMNSFFSTLWVSWWYLVIRNIGKFCKNEKTNVVQRSIHR